MKQFELSKDQLKKYEDWVEENNFSQIDAGAAGGAFTFSWTPTGLGDIVKVRHILGAELDLTEWEYF